MDGRNGCYVWYLLFFEDCDGGVWDWWWIVFIFLVWGCLIYVIWFGGNVIVWSLLIYDLSDYVKINCLGCDFFGREGL